MRCHREGQPAVDLELRVFARRAALAGEQVLGTEKTDAHRPRLAHRRDVGGKLDVGAQDDLGAVFGMNGTFGQFRACLLYTSDAADERSSVDLGGRRIITKKTHR